LKIAVSWDNASIYSAVEQAQRGNSMAVGKGTSGIGVLNEPVAIKRMEINEPPLKK
jgi:hypothetical protein